MSQRESQCSNPSPVRTGSPGAGDPPAAAFPNAFSADFLAELSRREPAPATPEADLAGPWRVTSLYGAGEEPRWACLAAGERRPRITLQAPDLAYLTAAALAVAGRSAAFRFQEDADRRLHLLWHGHPVGTSSGLIPVGGDTLPLHLTALADLRTRPLPFAHLLLAVPDEVLRRAGAIAVQLLPEAGR